jgi:hypothetical protein
MVDALVLLYFHNLVTRVIQGGGGRHHSLQEDVAGCSSVSSNRDSSRGVVVSQCGSELGHDECVEIPIRNIHFMAPCTGSSNDHPDFFNTYALPTSGKGWWSSQSV